MKKERKISLRKPAEILIVEDSLTQATQIKHLLESNHYKVSVAQNGKQALDKLSKHKPSLVISDILMPEINGYELCKKIKSNKNTQDIPVILLTRLFDPEEIIAGLSCGADSFITKPYNEKHLLSNIWKILSIENGSNYQKVPFGVQILFNGEKRTIQAEQQNVIRLLLNIYEGAVYQNEKLIQTREELRLLNEQLESAVEERTSDLREEMNMSNQIAERLRESEEKFRKIFEDHVAVKLLIDPVSGEIIDANKAAANYYGWSREEFKGMKMDKINTLTFKEIKKEMGNAVSKTKTHFEFRHRLKDGSIRDVEVLSSIIKIRNKDVLHSIVRDITDRKQSEEKIRILASFPSENPEPVLRVDRNGKLLYANEASYRLLTWELKPGSIVPMVLLIAVMNVLVTGHQEQVDEKNNHLLFSFDIIPVMEAGYVNIYGHDITERRLAEESLRESERMLRESQELAHLGTYVWDLLTGLWSSSVILDTIFGIDSKYEKSMPGWVNIVHPGWQKIMNDYVVNDVIGKHKKFDKEYQIIRQNDGSERWVHGLGALEFDSSGNPCKLKGTITDITERKIVEEALRESEERFSKSFMTSPISFMIANMEDGRIIEVNDAFSTISGYTREEALASTTLNLKIWVNERDRNHMIDSIRKGKAILHQETLLRAKGGNISTVLLSAQLIKLANRNCIISSIEDITKRKEAEAVVRIQSEIMSHMAEAVYLVRMEDGIIVYTNSRFEELFGYSPGEMIGKHVSIVNAPTEKSPGKTADEIMNDLNRNDSWAGEVLNIKKDGTVFWSHANVAIFDHSKFGKVLVSLQEDITDRKNAELQIKILNEELEGRVIQRTELLEAANKELEAFSYSVSHDLRAPLRAVHGYTKILMEDYHSTLDDEGKRICDVISSSATKMGELIDDLLSFSRIGRSDLNPSVIDMNKLVVMNFGGITSPTERERIKFKVSKLQKSYGDVKLISQVWINLISNAIKYSSKNKVSEIQIGSGVSDKMVTYFIKDNGVGFDMQYSHKLFGVFQRLHSESEFEGNGVGLAIVQRIILKHGGKVWAEGEVDKGATFYFSLPVNEE